MSAATATATATTTAIAPRVDRVLLASAAPSWRHRYAEEFGELLAITPAGVRRTAGITKLVIKSWLRPAKHLHTRRDRLQATLTTHLMLFFTLVAASTMYRFVSVDFLGPNESGSAIVWAQIGRRGIVAGSIVLILGLVPLVADVATHRGLRTRSIIRPLVVAAALVAIGSVIFVLTPWRSRVELQAASWFVVPVIVVLAAVPALGAATQRILAGSQVRRFSLAAAVAMTWLAVMVQAVDTFADTAMRFALRNGEYFGTAGYFRTWQAYILLLVVFTLIGSTVSMTRALVAVVRRRPVVDEPAT